MKQIRLLVPTENEQRRIVTEIEKQFTRLEAGVTALRRVQANLKRYRAAVLKAACEGRLVPTEAALTKTGNRKAKFETGEGLLARILTERRQSWRGRGAYKESAVLDTAHLPRLPEGWTWATLDQLGQEGRPIIYGIIKPGPHIPDGVPYVRVTEMKDGRIDVPNLRRASRERAAKFARATLAPGDVLISKDGTIGRVAVVPTELAGGNITQHVMRAPIHAMMFRDFVVWAIRSDWCQHWLTGETRGVALRGVNVEDFRRLPIPLPPLAEQTRIVAEVERRLSVVEELEAVVSANLQRAGRLRQSILQKAFTGRLVARFG
jgi:type I restriction enzyme S subunit